MEENIVMVPGSGTKVIVRDVKEEIESAFLDYSMSVIVSRALPDVRDGLKPVHRRILYTMHIRGNDPQHPYRKSADTVGAVLGSFHPHGDASVYDAMVRLAQDFSLRYPLVDGQGNFGSVDGDPPAAYRYTEARMSKMACEMLTDIDKETIDWALNFDETKKEPSVLPSRFPNLLVNGSQGIAVGMATNIPPHNLREVVNGMIALIDDPDIDLPGLMEYVKGPDFPTGGIIMGRSGIRAAYATGRGKITLRGRAEIVEKKNGRFEIIVTEIPYMVNKARLIESIADYVKDKKIEGISDLNDESSRKGMRIVIEVKKDANPQVVLNQLYRLYPAAGHGGRHHAGPGQKRPQDHAPQEHDAEVYRLPGRGRPPSDPVRPEKGGGALPYPGRPETRRGHRGRGHLRHPPLRRRPGRGQGGHYGAVRL